MKEQTKNPKQFWSCVRKQTLTLENFLTAPKTEDGVMLRGGEPLNFYDSTFSLFKAALINDQRKAATGNISVSDVPDIAERTRYAHMKHMDAQISPGTGSGSGGETSGGSSPGYTVRIMSGKLKGRTPAEIIATDGQAGVAALQEQFNWLKSNLEKYPKNRTQMEAILDAVKAAQEGKIGTDPKPAAASAAGLRIPIYTPGYRPLRRKTREDGKSFIYEVEIYWNTGQEYPVEFIIQNYYAPVVEKENGMLNVQTSQKADGVKNTMYLSAKEWNNAVYMMLAQMRSFEIINAASAYKTATTELVRQRENAGQNNGQNY